MVQLVLLVFSIFWSFLGLDYILDIINQSSELQSNNNFGSAGANNNSSSHNNRGPQLPQNNNLLHNTQTQDEADESDPSTWSQPKRDEFIRNNMARRLQDTQLPVKFSEAEHQYICEKMENYHNNVHSVGPLFGKI